MLYLLKKTGILPKENFFLVLRSHFKLGHLTSCLLNDREALESKKDNNNYLAISLSIILISYSFCIRRIDPEIDVD